MEIVTIIIAVVLMMLFFGILGFSIKAFGKLIINSISGILLLIIFNFIGGIFGITLDLTFLNAIVAGIFGIPGIIVLLLLKS
ncbi:pro-sigmaK processing inhibitor BofA family protein [Lagierella massiliensis]|uniref:pro-sigmaK processing inhibitor BofA family protein n=1 Tax=Lagierella massiliensis TaxID=1689303 RepID=UPI0006D845A5|nr:pro-sigmaK processing inhibitor BofA family protein [Lagierella massiliensis]